MNKRVCTKRNCNRTLYARGFCHKHYKTEWVNTQGIKGSPNFIKSMLHLITNEIGSENLIGTSKYTTLYSNYLINYNIFPEKIQNDIIVSSLLGMLRYAVIEYYSFQLNSMTEPEATASTRNMLTISFDKKVTSKKPLDTLLENIENYREEYKKGKYSYLKVIDFTVPALKLINAGVFVKKENLKKEMLPYIIECKEAAGSKNT